MKKSWIVLSLLIISILIISVTAVSAGWFDDFWNKITGRATEEDDEEEEEEEEDEDDEEEEEEEEDEDDEEEEEEEPGNDTEEIEVPWNVTNVTEEFEVPVNVTNVTEEIEIPEDVAEEAEEIPEDVAEEEEEVEEEEKEVLPKSRYIIELKKAPLLKKKIALDEGGDVEEVDYEEEEEEIEEPPEEQEEEEVPEDVTEEVEVPGDVTEEVEEEIPEDVAEEEEEDEEEEGSEENEPDSNPPITGSAIKNTGKEKALEDYKKELETEHFLALSDIQDILVTGETSFIDKVINAILTAFRKTIRRYSLITGSYISPNRFAPPMEFYTVFNGVVMDLDKNEVEKIKQSKYVKGIYPDLEVETTLRDSIPLINADDVWQLTDSNGDLITGKGVVIAVIDTGVDYTHPDLGGCLGSRCKVIGGYDFVNRDNNPKDDHFHGTHCAGTAAGNGVLKGVAPDAKILAYKVLNRYGSGTFSNVLAGIERAVDPNQDGDFSDHADIISMSLGARCYTYSTSCGPDDIMSRAIDTAVDAGVVAVIAAGNEDGGANRIRTPATARKAITIAATDKRDGLAYFSSRGPVIWQGETIDKPNLAAPGVSIYAQTLNGGYRYLSGTSMACPHVAGAAALLLQQDPELTPYEIKQTLQDSAVALPYTQNEVGAGRLDSLAAYDLLPGPKCKAEDTRACGTDVGECKKGVQTCVDEEWGECVGNIGPIEEVCDGSDNDCDGEIDDDLTPELCDEQRGVCKGSVKQCGGIPGWIACNSLSYGPEYESPKELSCSDLKDNDCDGKPDLQDTEDCECTLVRANWGKTTVIEGDKVNLFVSGDTCQWLTVSFEIKEKTLFGDKTVFSHPGIKFPQNSVTFISWIAEHNKLIGNPKYYFIASLVNSAKKISSEDFENGILTVVKLIDSDGDGIDDRRDKCPYTPNYLKDCVNRYGCPIPIANNFDIKPDFRNVNLSNLTGFEIGKSNLGKISYSKRLSLLQKIKEYYERLDLDSYIKISDLKVELDAEKLPMLNEAATITMYNVDLEEPVIVKDGKVCEECELIYWNKNIGTAVFSVPHFTAYELIEGEEEPPAPPGTPPSGGGPSGGDEETEAPEIEEPPITPEECVRKVINGVLTTVCYTVSCNINEDCKLEVPTKLFECLPCDPYDCNIYDAGDDEVIAVNKNWIPDCPEVKLPGICPACIGSIEGNYMAKCMNDKCLKLTDDSDLGYIQNKEVVIEKISEEIFLMKVGSISVKTSLEIVIETGRIYVKTSGGNKKIRLLPEEAISKAVEIETVNLDEIKIQEYEGEAIYSISGTKKVKIFFMFPVAAKVEQKINVESGEIISTTKPWWSFFSF